MFIQFLAIENKIKVTGNDSKNKPEIIKIEAFGVENLLVWKAKYIPKAVVKIRYINTDVR